MHTIGPHTSIAGGLENALVRAHELGANALGMFTKNQRQWKAKPLASEEIALFVQTCTKLGCTADQVLVHDSYLINLANPDAQTRQQSLEALIDELKRVELLGLKLLNFHPGSHLNQIDAKQALRLVAESLDIALAQTDRAIAVIENTAGQGSNLGSNFEELAYLNEQCTYKDRVGFCIDKLRGMHLNDAKAPSASRLDRHESLGKGTIGWPTFEHISSDPRFEGIPLVLETIDTQLWNYEVARLRRGTV